MNAGEAVSLMLDGRLAPTATNATNARRPATGLQDTRRQDGHSDRITVVRPYHRVRARRPYEPATGPTRRSAVTGGEQTLHVADRM